jgi:hypothetical protein
MCARYTVALSMCSSSGYTEFFTDAADDLKPYCTNDKAAVRDKAVKVLHHIGITDYALHSSSSSSSSTSGNNTASTSAAANNSASVAVPVSDQDLLGDYSDSLLRDIDDVTDTSHHTNASTTSSSSTDANGYTAAPSGDLFSDMMVTTANNTTSTGVAYVDNSSILTQQQYTLFDETPQAPPAAAAAVDASSSFTFITPTALNSTNASSNRAGDSSTAGIDLLSMTTLQSQLPTITTPIAVSPTREELLQQLDPMRCNSPTVFDSSSSNNMTANSAPSAAADTHQSTMVASALLPQQQLQQQYAMPTAAGLTHVHSNMNNQYTNVPNAMLGYAQMHGNGVIPLQQQQQQRQLQQLGHLQAMLQQQQQQQQHQQQQHMQYGQQMQFSMQQQQQQPYSSMQRNSLSVMNGIDSPIRQRSGIQQQQQQQDEFSFVQAAMHDIGSKASISK